MIKSTSSFFSHKLQKPKKDKLKRIIEMFIDLKDMSTQIRHLKP